MKTSFCAVGDMLVQRRIPKKSEGFKEVSEYLNKADAKYVNLETTLHRGEHFPNQFNGGSYLRCDPEILEDIKEYGFNMLSFANNHSMDFGHGGLLATKKAVDEAGIKNAGAGNNIDEASAPCYIDTPNGRIALIGVVSSMENVSALAGPQSRRYPGRPGVNGLRIDESVVVTKEQFEAIKQIEKLSKINAQKNIERAEGYYPPVPEGFASLKDLKFQLGDETKYVTHPNSEDLLRVEKAIYEAQMQADYILVTVHSHELSGDKKENPAQFLQEFAHFCIDKGAHAVIGHGPHLLRPVEIYKGFPIFYSLGNFVIHNECIPYAPEEMYKMQGLTSDDTMRDFFCKRSKNYTRGLMRDRRMLESVIPYVEFVDGKVNKIELMPIELNFDLPVWRSGNPRFSNKHNIIERLRDMSKEFGTTIEIDERGYGIVKVN